MVETETTGDSAIEMQRKGSSGIPNISRANGVGASGFCNVLLDEDRRGKYEFRCMFFGS